MAAYTFLSLFAFVFAAALSVLSRHARSSTETRSARSSVWSSGLPVWLGATGGGIGMLIGPGLRSRPVRPQPAGAKAWRCRFRRIDPARLDPRSQLERAGDTIACVRSLTGLTFQNREVVVIDNGSTDDSADTIRASLPGVTSFGNPRNWGFAAGNNVGVRRALARGSDYVWLLNSDTVVEACVARRARRARGVRPARRDRRLRAPFRRRLGDRRGVGRGAPGPLEACPCSTPHAPLHGVVAVGERRQHAYPRG